MSRSNRARAFRAAILIGCAGASADGTAAGVCDQTEAEQAKVPILSPPLGERVIGKGRLQFYAAPNAKCRLTGVFVVPGDALVAYAESDDGWMSVMHATTGQQGWVRASRLKTTGTMGPRQ